MTGQCFSGSVALSRRWNHEHRDLPLLAMSTRYRLSVRRGIPGSCGQVSMAPGQGPH